MSHFKPQQRHIEIDGRRLHFVSYEEREAIAREAAQQEALDAAEDQGWQIVEADVNDGRIEATDRTFWFGFYDDVVIRLTPVEGRTVVDIRSKSRVGLSDVGANARRIREYVDALTT